MKTTRRTLFKRLLGIPAAALAAVSLGRRRKKVRARLMGRWLCTKDGVETKYISRLLAEIDEPRNRVMRAICTPWHRESCPAGWPSSVPATAVSPAEAPEGTT